MVGWVGFVETMRTTSDGAGRAHSVVTALGEDPQKALDQLRKDAYALLAREAKQEQEADEKARSKRPAGPSRPVTWPSPGQQVRGGGSDGHWPGSVPGQERPKYQQELRRFEVVDVRLVPARLESGGNGWLAYGTLVHLRGS